MWPILPQPKHCRLLTDTKPRPTPPLVRPLPSGPKPLPRPAGETIAATTPRPTGTNLTMTIRSILTAKSSTEKPGERLALSQLESPLLLTNWLVMRHMPCKKWLFAGAAWRIYAWCFQSLRPSVIARIFCWSVSVTGDINSFPLATAYWSIVSPGCCTRAIIMAVYSLKGSVDGNAALC